MHPEDTTIFANGIIGKYADCPDDLENECYADFATGLLLLFQILMKKNLAKEKSLFWKTGLEKWGNELRVMRYHKVSELENPELHCVTLLQLYMPWRNEDKLKRDCSTYAKKFEFVKDDIVSNIKKHDAFYGKFDVDDLLGEVLDGVDHDLLDQDEENIGPSDHGVLNPDLLDLNVDE